MSGIFEVLHIAHTGLSAQQLGLQVTGNNIANVNTPGYARQRVILSPAPIAGNEEGSHGTGVRIDGVERFYSRYLDIQVVQQKQAMGEMDARNEIMGQIEPLFTDLDDGGLANDVSALFNSFRELAAHPTGTAERQAVIGAAESVAENFNSIVATAQDIRETMKNQIKDMVSEINSLGAQLAEINKAMAIQEAQGGNVLSLMDQRQSTLEELSELVEINPLDISGDTSKILIAGEHPLVDGGNFYPISWSIDSTDPENIIIRDSTGADVSAEIDSGRMGGTLDIYQNYLPSYMADLDQLAYTLTTEINAVHRAGYGLDGGTGRGLFVEPVTVDGAAGMMAIDPAVSGNTDAIAAAIDAADLPGGNGNAALLAEVQNNRYFAGGTLTIEDYYTDITSRVGIDARSAELGVDRQERMLEESINFREQASGVSIDEEAINLMRYQRAYEASARVVSAADELLQALLNMV